MRLLGAGSRAWDDYTKLNHGLVSVFDTLRTQFPEDKKLVVVDGECPPRIKWDFSSGKKVFAGYIGADHMINLWARKVTAPLAKRGYDVSIERHPADWSTHGLGAGPKRNQHMVDLGADAAVFFFGPTFTGTKDCAIRAKTAGIPLYMYFMSADIEAQVRRAAPRLFSNR